MQQASYLEGGPLVWMLALYLHVIQKSDYDDDYDTQNRCCSLLPVEGPETLKGMLLALRDVCSEDKNKTSHGIG